MHAIGLLEVALIDGGVGDVGQRGDNRTEDDTQKLTENGDRDRDGHCSLGRCAGEAREGCGDDTAQNHIRRNRSADLNQAHAHKLDGGANGEAGGNIAQHHANKRGSDERLLKIQATEQAGIEHAEDADQANEDRANERIHTFLLSVDAYALPFTGLHTRLRTK